MIGSSVWRLGNVMLVCGARSHVHHHQGRTMIFEEFNRFMPCLCTNWRMSIFNDANSTGHSEPDDSSKTRTYSCLRIFAHVLVKNQSDFGCMGAAHSTRRARISKRVRRRPRVSFSPSHQDWVLLATGTG